MALNLLLSLHRLIASTALILGLVPFCGIDGNIKGRQICGLRIQLLFAEYITEFPDEGMRVRKELVRTADHKPDRFGKRLIVTY